MTRTRPIRTTPKIPGRPVRGTDELRPSPGNSVYLHQGKYHVFVGLSKVLVTNDLTQAMTEAARTPAE